MDPDDVEMSSPAEKISSPIAESAKCVKKFLREIFRSGLYADVKLICRGGTILSHRLVLASISPVFRRVLDSNPDASFENEVSVEIPDLEVTVLEDLLERIYCGGTEKVDLGGEEIAFLGMDPECKVNLPFSRGTAAAASAKDTFKFEEKQLKIKLEVADYNDEVDFSNDYDDLDEFEDPFGDDELDVHEDELEEEEEEGLVEEQSKSSDSDEDYNPGYVKKRKKSLSQSTGEASTMPKWRKRTNGSRKTSPVWHFFSPFRNEVASCNECGKLINTKSKSTSGMRAHLKGVHPELYLEMFKIQTVAELNEESFGGELNASDYVVQDFAKKPSFVWKCFTKVEGDSTLVQCHSCDTVLENVTVIDLKEHLEEFHKERYDELVEEQKQEDASFGFGTPTSKKTSLVWNHFVRISADSASCIECGSVIKSEGGTTSGMNTHLKCKHKEIFEEMQKIRKEIQAQQPPKDEEDEEIAIMNKNLNRRRNLKRKKPSFVWLHFTKLDRDHSKCNICENVYKSESHSTSGLIAHLTKKHGIAQHNERDLTNKDSDPVDKEQDAELLVQKKLQFKTEVSENVSDSPAPVKKVQARSFVWDYFKKLKGGQAVCSLCTRTMKLYSSSTSGLRAHLKSHGIYERPQDLDKEKESEGKDEEGWNAGQKLSKSYVWGHFTQVEQDLFCCDHCQTLLTVNDGKIQNLRKHLYLHGIKEKSFQEEDEEREKLIQSEREKLLANEIIEKDSETLENDEEKEDEISVNGKKTSFVWKYFTQLNKHSVRCVVCLTALRLSVDCSTGGLVRHLRIHKIFNPKAVQLKETPSDNFGDLSFFEDEEVAQAMAKNRKSAVWLFFDKVSKKYSKCKECNTLIKSERGSTTGMRAHINTHPGKPEELFKEELARQSKEEKKEVHVVNKEEGGDQEEPYSLDNPFVFDRVVSEKRKKSAIWGFFESKEGAGICNVCKVSVPCAQHTTSGMIKHLRSHHSTEFEEFIEKTAEQKVQQERARQLKMEKLQQKLDKKEKKLEFLESEENRTCKKCLKIFSCRQGMLFHVRSVHAEKKAFKCETCSMEFTRLDSYKSHVHYPGPKNLCQICGKIFGRKSARDRHEKTHFNDRPAQCSYCEKRFYTNSEKIYHERTHTGEKPYQCDDCGKRFAKKTQLVNHSRTHTGEKPFPCKYCDKMFAFHSSRNKHKCEGRFRHDSEAII